MAKRPKTIYKARYEIDIEFTDEPWSDMDLADKEDDFRARLVSASRHFPQTYNLETLEAMNAQFDYVEKHFPDALHNLYFGMLLLEARIDRMGRANVRRVGRNAVLNRLMKIEDRYRRERLAPKPDDAIRQPNQYREKDREKFISSCVQGIQKITADGKKLTKGSLGAALFGGPNHEHSNPSQALARLLKHYEITLPEIVTIAESEHSS